MEKETMTQQDYVRYDRVWQRVAPELDPYPEVRAAMGRREAPQPRQLPDTPERSCCLASDAMGELDSISRFIEEELEDRRAYMAYARCAPNPAARRILRDLAMEEGNHARRLMSVYYIIAGECYKPSVAMGRVEVPPWCQLLRSRYQAESCGGYQYQRAAQETQDVCLSHIFAQLSADEYRHASQLLHLLEGNMLA